MKVSELRAVTDQLFTYLEETGRDECVLTEDYYWTIANEDLYDVSKHPKDLTIGQLSDDWNELRAVLKNESPPIGYALVWLSSILRILGEKSAY